VSSPRFLKIDFETRSTVDLRKSGVYRYAEDPTTDVWCAAYQVDDRPIKVWHLGEDAPREVEDALSDGAYIRAWNAAFERIIWREILSKRHGWPYPGDDKFVCSMVVAAAAGLPMSLEEAAIVLGLQEQKDMAGSRLMMQMTKPRKVNNDGTIIWWDDAAKRERLAEYCRQDVRTEDAAWRRLPACMGRSERRLYLLDQRINDRGVRLDLPLIHAGQLVAKRSAAGLTKELQELTGGVVSAPTKIEDLKTWIRSYGIQTDVLDKARVETLLSGKALPDNVRRALEIRQEAAKTSVKKLTAMTACVGADERVRGLLQFYGAGTGRWSGRLIQPQNFPKGTVKITEEVIQAVLSGNPAKVRKFGNPLEVLSSLLRGTIIASPDRALYVADYNAIEARVIAWLADETRMIGLFASGGKVYEAMAARIFGVKIADVTPEQRQVGKMVVLACGFGMGPEKFAAQAGVDIELARQAVASYRELNSKIKQFWYDADDAAVTAVKRRSTVPIRAGKHIAFRVVGNWLAMDLPSGRALWYHRPRIVERPVPWGGTKPAVEIDCRNSVTRQWEAAQMYGGIWAENATQAVARDLMCGGIVRTEAAGFSTILTVHDEIIAEAAPDRSVEEYVALLSVVPEWAAGCPVKAEGWSGNRYRK
jgi:DNA polymerase